MIGALYKLNVLIERYPIKYYMPDHWNINNSKVKSKN